MNNVLEWKGEQIVTIGDMMRKGIDRCDSPEEAREFMRLLRLNYTHADENIGYLSGYYSASDMNRIQDWFEVSHPVFGKGAVGAETALAKGIAMGLKAKK